MGDANLALERHNLGQYRTGSSGSIGRKETGPDERSRSLEWTLNSKCAGRSGGCLGNTLWGVRHEEQPNLGQLLEPPHYMSVPDLTYPERRQADTWLPALGSRGLSRTCIRVSTTLAIELTVDGPEHTCYRLDLLGGSDTVPHPVQRRDPGSITTRRQHWGLCRYGRRASDIPDMICHRRM
eukprot:3308440-Rhodomonas_salina.3